MIPPRQRRVVPSYASAMSENLFTRESDVHIIETRCEWDYSYVPSFHDVTHPLIPARGEK